MKNRQTTSALPSWKLFFFFCFGSYLLSMSYGTTFLLSLLIVARGGSEADVGMVISIAMLSTFAAVLLSGHLTDSIGAAKAIACSGVALAAACFGFALTGSFGASLLACGLILGLGWGVFYTLGPIIVAMMIEPARRAAYFAILSGSMMSGIGSGPLIGRALTASGFAIASAFYVAALASLLGAAVFGCGPESPDYMACQCRHSAVEGSAVDSHGWSRCVYLWRAFQFSDFVCQLARAGLRLVFCRLHVRRDCLPLVRFRFCRQMRCLSVFMYLEWFDDGIDAAVSVFRPFVVQLCAGGGLAGHRLWPDLFGHQWTGGK